MCALQSIILTSDSIHAPHLSQPLNLSPPATSPRPQHPVIKQANADYLLLQVTVWGDYGRMDRKVFMGVAQIILDDLDLSNIVIGWYKLFTSSSLVSHHQATGTSSAGGSRRNSGSSIESAYQSGSTRSQPRSSSQVISRSSRDQHVEFFLGVQTYYLNHYVYNDSCVVV